MHLAHTPPWSLSTKHIRTSGYGRDARHGTPSPSLLTVELCRSDDRFNLSRAQHAQGRAATEPRIGTDEPGHLRPGPEGVERCQRLFMSGDRSVLAELPCWVEVATAPHRQPNKSMVHRRLDDAIARGDFLVRGDLTETGEAAGE